VTSYFALIPAAGSGARMDAACPKQYLLLAGQRMIHHALHVLCRHARIAHVYVVLAADDVVWDEHDGSLLTDRLTVLRCGGATRAESVRNGLAAMAGRVSPDDWVLVHDAARPCLQAAHIDALLDGVAANDSGGILAVPVADTLKLAEGDSIAKTVSRANLWQAQTPQMFRHGLLIQALDSHAGLTDEASAVEALGLHPQLVMSDTTNLKVTYPPDLQLAEWILQNRTKT
jgi:2-C-methyl-D-erythritol 4-phosphate cytidylyltransferase